MGAVNGRPVTTPNARNHERKPSCGHVLRTPNVPSVAPAPLYIPWVLITATLALWTLVRNQLISDISNMKSKFFMLFGLA